MTLLLDLVNTSQRVGATTARLAKVRELATFLRSLPPDEIDTAVHYLSGELPQGRIGIGYSVLKAAAANSPRRRCHSPSALLQRASPGSRFKPSRQ